MGNADDLIREYSVILEKIYEKQTVGDYTFLGVLCEFAKALDRIRKPEEIMTHWPLLDHVLGTRTKAQARNIRNGMEDRYFVKKIADVDGIHDDCEYFVLDPLHDYVARGALAFYATHPESDDELTKILLEWIERLDKDDEEI